VRVTDFGLARSVLAPEDVPKPATTASPLHVDLTATGTVLGTPRYMPPEQLLGPDIDARSDQFSFCVALYEALYGVHPLTGGTATGMLERDERATPPPDAVRLPSAIGRAVMRGLERDRGRRFPTMSVLLGELTPPPERSPVRYAAVALVSLLLIGGATAAAWMMRTPSEHRVEGDDVRAIKPLLDRIRVLEAETKHLRDTLLTMPKPDEVDRLKQELVEKDGQIHALVDKVTELRQQQERRAQGPAPAQRSTQVIAAVQGAQGDVEGCFAEWAERTPGKDADLLVKLTVAPNGAGGDALASGTDSESLRVCVAAAIARIHYPRGPDRLDLEVPVAWTEGNLAMTGRVVAYHEAASGTLDGI